MYVAKYSNVLVFFKAHVSTQIKMSFGHRTIRLSTLLANFVSLYSFIFLKKSYQPILVWFSPAGQLKIICLYVVQLKMISQGNFICHALKKQNRLVSPPCIYHTIFSNAHCCHAFILQTTLFSQINRFNRFSCPCFR